MAILEQYLKKVGVGLYQDLSEEEKKTYREWDEALRGRKLTDDDVKVFLDTQFDSAVEKLAAQILNEREDTFLKMKITFISQLRIFLNSPEMEKKAIENGLQQMMN